jgi:hypothetical protein
MIKGKDSCELWVEVVERAAVVPHRSFVLDRWFLFMKASDAQAIGLTG